MAKDAVVPGDGGGTGTVGDPFRGLQAAADSATAGDVFEVAPGNYAAFRNNVFLGTRYAFEFTTVADEGFRDLDYNGWGTTREVGGPSDPWFKWDNVRYDRLVDLQAVGVELHGMEAGFADLVNAALPAAWDQPVEPGSRDLRLAGDAPEIDAGTQLPNLNDGFSLNGPPDLGAIEHGVAAPHYGPRPRAQFADGFESGDTSNWSLTRR